MPPLEEGVSMALTCLNISITLLILFFLFILIREGFFREKPLAGATYYPPVHWKSF